MSKGNQNVVAAGESADLPPLAVSAKQACRISGLGLTSIYELMRNGTLRSKKVGGRRLVEYASLRALVTPKS